MKIKDNSILISTIMLKQLMLQSERESIISVRLNMIAVILSYCIINLILLLEVRDISIFIAAVVAILGLAILIVVSYLREKRIRNRTLQNINIGSIWKANK